MITFSLTQKFFRLPATSCYGNLKVIHSAFQLDSTYLVSSPTIPYPSPET